MNLAQFAKKAGVQIVRQGLGGASICYKEADHPNCTVGGFRTENAAYKHWLGSTFGERTSKAVMSLLRRVDRSNA